MVQDFSHQQYETAPFGTIWILVHQLVQLVRFHKRWGRMGHWKVEFRTRMSKSIMVHLISVESLSQFYEMVSQIYHLLTSNLAYTNNRNRLSIANSKRQFCLIFEFLCPFFLHVFIAIFTPSKFNIAPHKWWKTTFILKWSLFRSKLLILKLRGCNHHEVLKITFFQSIVCWDSFVYCNYRRCIHSVDQTPRQVRLINPLFLPMPDPMPEGLSTGSLAHWKKGQRWECWGYEKGVVLPILVGGLKYVLSSSLPGEMIQFD